MKKKKKETALAVKLVYFVVLSQTDKAAANYITYTVKSLYRQGLVHDRKFQVTLTWKSVKLY